MDRFAFTDGPVRVFTPRQIQKVATSTISNLDEFESGHLRHGGGIMSSKPKRGKVAQPVGICLRDGGHEWKSKGEDVLGSRLVKCKHCGRSTTAANAGVTVPPLRARSSAPIIPMGTERACTDAAGHKWHRNGTVNGIDRIVCALCGVKSKQKKEGKEKA